MKTSHGDAEPQRIINAWTEGLSRRHGVTEALISGKTDLSRRHGVTEMHENEIGTIVVDCAVRLHRDLGPGLLESVYEMVLARQLRKRGLTLERQVPVPVQFDGEIFEAGFRADLVVEGKVIVELKSVEQISPVHKKQLLTYLRLSGLKLGYLLNFGDSLMKDGITRTINGKL